MIEKYAKGKVAVFIDAANIESSVRDEGFKLNHRKLSGFLRRRLNLIHFGYYTVGFKTRNHQNFLKFLKRAHFTVKVKPLKIIREVRKANFDVEIAVDVMDLRQDFDTMILLSGDSDFDYLVKRIKKENKKVIVISLRRHIALELIKSADKYIPLTKFKGVLKKSPRQRRGM